MQDMQNIVWHCKSFGYVAYFAAFICMCANVLKIVHPPSNCLNFHSPSQWLNVISRKQAAASKAEKQSQHGIKSCTSSTTCLSVAPKPTHVEMSNFSGERNMFTTWYQKSSAQLRMCHFEWQLSEHMVAPKQHSLKFGLHKQPPIFVHCRIIWEFNRVRSWRAGFRFQACFIHVLKRWQLQSSPLWASKSLQTDNCIQCRIQFYLHSNRSRHDCYLTKNVMT